MGFFGNLFLWFFFGNLFWYLVGSFIAFDFNPINWWLLSHTVGRIIFVIIEIFIFSISIKASEELS
jgi:hypothetical protein